MRRRRRRWVGAWARRAGAAGVAGRARRDTAAATCSATSAPESQLGGGSLVDRYPLSAYALDYHVDVGVTDPDGVPPMIAHWAAAQLWSADELSGQVA